MFQVKVNATSANVCVGFDVLGLALELPNTFTFEKSDNFEFYGFEPEYCNIKNNMVYDAYVKTFEYAKKKVIPARIGFKGDIPVSRGLGSSSSLIVGGVYGANHMMGDILTDEDCLNISCDIEGHPDNVAPAIYGGLIASFKGTKGYKSTWYPVASNLRFNVIIPPFKLSTHEARGVLPKVLPYADIVSNLSRIVNIPKAFGEGDVELLKELFVDKLHEPYRGPLIKGYAEIKKFLESEEAAFAISGSGSTMLVVSKDDSMADKLKRFNYEVKTLKVGSGVKVEEV